MGKITTLYSTYFSAKTPDPHLSRTILYSSNFRVKTPDPPSYTDSGLVDKEILDLLLHPRVSFDFVYLHTRVSFRFYTYIPGLVLGFIPTYQG